MKWLQKIFGRRTNSSRNPEMVTRPISCEVADFDAEHFCGTSVLCEAYLLKGNFTLNEIANFIRKTRDTHPDAQLFASLDDPGQAAYTSTHSTLFHELDSLDGHDEASLPDSAYKAFDDEKIYIGYFPFRLINFMREVAKFVSHSMENQIGWIGMDQYCATIRTGATVKELERNKESLVQIVPVQHPAEALAAFPNGYFDDDLDPFENYVLARELYDRFELSLFGIGATYLGFMAEAPLGDKEVASITEFLMTCIDGYSDKPPLNGLLHEMLRGQTEIYIVYGTSSFHP